MQIFKNLNINIRAFQKNKIFEFGCGDQILTAFGLHETNKKKFMDTHCTDLYAHFTEHLKCPLLRDLVCTIVKGKKCQYLGPWAMNKKNKDTLLSQTLNVKEKKVSLFL